MSTDALAVMYHYVWPDARPVPRGIRPLLSSEFEAQLDWLSKRYEITSPDIFLRRVSEGSWAGKPPCLLTFDDGTRDHAEVVTPILARRNLSGLFFILTWPIELGRMPLTHTVHWLLGQDEREVWEAFKHYAVKNLGGVEALGTESEARKIYHYETPLRGRIKFAANMALAPNDAEKVVGAALAARGKNESDLARQWFVSADQVVTMQKSGMVIGLHGVSHRSLQALGGHGMASEIRHSSTYVNKLIGRPARWWACPFGGSGADERAQREVRAALSEVGISAAVTTDVKFVPAHCDPLAVPRLDCIDLPPRKK